MEWFSGWTDSNVWILAIYCDCSDSSTETMFIRRMVEYVASDSRIFFLLCELVQNGTELTDSINKTIDDVILRDVIPILIAFIQ